MVAMRKNFLLNKIKEQCFLKFFFRFLRKTLQHTKRIFTNDLDAGKNLQKTTKYHKNLILMQKCDRKLDISFKH